MTDSYEIYHDHYHDYDDIYPIYSIDITYLLTCSRIIVSLWVVIIGATVVRLSIIEERPCLYIMFMHSDNDNEHDNDDSDDADDDDDDDCQNENDDSDDRLIDE